MAKISTYGIHDMFNFEWDESKINKFSYDPSKTESSTVVENNGITLSVDIPDSAVLKIAGDIDLTSKSIISKIDYLLLTHLDSDHISGIDKLLWWKVFGEKQKLNIIAHPENFENLWDRLKYGFAQNRIKSSKEIKNILDYINFIPLDFGEEANLPDFGIIKSFDRSTKHSPGMPVTAFKVFDENSKNIANFSGDSSYDSELIDFLSTDGKAPIIHEIGAYQEGSHSHTHINELINNVPEKVHSRIFTNHIPVQMEDNIKQIIEDSGSNISFADEFYPNSKKKEVVISKLYNFSQNTGLGEIESKINTILKPKVVVFSGSFDPWTYGHEAVVRDHLKMNPNSIVKIIIGVNPSKKGTFTPKERKILIEKSIGNDIKNNIEVDIFNGVISDYIYENGYSHIIKGIRNSTDFDYEKDIATLSQRFSGNVMTSFIPQIDSTMAGVSSSSLKALAGFGGDIYADADPVIREALRLKTKGQWIIGLTGGIASGKSTLGKGLNKLSQNYDIKINYLNLDEITNDIHTKNDSEIYQRTRNKLAEKFGANILKLDGTTNKKKLGEIVFNDSLKMKELMDIMLEPLIYFLKKKINNIKSSGVILVEGAIIFDRKLTYLFDENIINIGVSEQKQRERILNRDGLNRGQVQSRLDNQVFNTDRIKGIKEIQSKFNDRFFMNIDGDNYDIEKIYKNIVGKFNNRKNICK